MTNTLAPDWLLLVVVFGCLISACAGWVVLLIR
jgi:hypothetical protein